MNKTQSTIVATSRKKCKFKTASWLVLLVVLSLLLNDDAHNHVSAFTTPSSSLLLSGLVASSSFKCRYSCYSCRSFAYTVGHGQEGQEDAGKREDGGRGGGGEVQHHLFHHHGATTTYSRRDFTKHVTDNGKILSTLVLSTTAAATTATTKASTANAAGVDSPAAAEIIRQSAAKIPGYGQPDVYYPPFFLGRWRVTRVIVSLSTEYDNPLLLSSSSSLSSLTVPFALTYDVRFISVGNDSGSDTTKVIADRAFNTASFYQALRLKLQQQQQQVKEEENNILKEKVIKDKMVEIPTSSPSPIPLPSIQKVDWSSSNPNTYTIYYSDGSWKEIRVTKRASEWNKEEGGGIASVFSSEYQRVCTTGRTSSGTATSIPVIEAVRVMTKWKSQGWEKNMGKEGEGQDMDVEENERNQVVVEGIEVVYLDDTARNGGMGGTGSGGTNVVMKSRLKLERIL